MVCMQCMQCMHCMLCMHVSCSGRLEELSFDIGLVHTAPLADKPSMQTQVAVKTELGIAYFKVPPLRPVPPRRPLRPPAKWEPRSCRVGAALVPSGSRARAACARAVGRAAPVRSARHVGRLVGPRL